MGCAQRNTLEVKAEIPTVPTEPETIKTYSLEPKPVLYLCITSRPPGWPVDQAINDWNVNGKNQFTFSSNNDTTHDVNGHIKCRDTVTIKLVSSTRYEGETEFLKNGIEVRLEKSSPVKLHTLCHELGHVLGLPHNQDPQSCMNISRTATQPSTQDIVNAGAKYWIKEESARHATGQ